MELKHLQALLGIADTGSFSAAAATIGTVQSNVSAHIARLERELQVQLVDRSSGRLTEEGDVVVERARRVMSELTDMVADVVALRQEVVGTVRLGMIGTTGRWLVPQLFDLLRARHPHIHLNVAEGSSMQLEVQLGSGQLDLAVVTLPLSGDEVIAAHLFDEDLMLVVPRDHPWAKETSSPPRPIGRHGTSAPGSGYGPAGGDRRRRRTGPGRPASRHGARWGPDDRLPRLRRLRLGHPPGHRRARPPAGALRASCRIDGMPRRRVGVAQRRRGLLSAPAKAVIDVLGLVVADSLAMPDGIHPTAVPA